MSSPSSPDRLRFTLLQARRPDDPMRAHELGCFARALSVAPDRIGAVDLLHDGVGRDLIDSSDVFLIGGSGDYSVAGEEDGLERALDDLRRVHASGTPTFASCWGFQALSRAMGGLVVNDVERAEVGTCEVFLTEAGARDPVFSGRGPTFGAQMGHEDHVDRLPPNATLLASSGRNPHQAFRFDDAPIYCTQFHPEVDAAGARLRLTAYPQYLEALPDGTPEAILSSLADTPASADLIPRFLQVVFP